MSADDVPGKKGREERSKDKRNLGIPRAHHTQVRLWKALPKMPKWSHSSPVCNTKKARVIHSAVKMLHVRPALKATYALSADGSGREKGGLTPDTEKVPSEHNL